MDAFSEMPVLVTGAAGFLGQPLVARLRQLGASVTCLLGTLDTAPPQWREGARPPTVQVADVTQPAAVASVFAQAHPRRVYHLAALTAPSRDLADLPGYLHVNAEGTACVLSACAAESVESVIVMGTCEEYGADAPVPFHEDLPPRPTTPYGISKAAATAICQAAYRSTRLPVTVLRATVLYGPRQPGRFFIAQLVEAAATRTPLDMTEGKQTRDFLHVQDAVEGILMASSCEGLRGEIANLCSEDEIALCEVAAMWERLCGKPGLIRLGAVPYREHEPFRYVGSAAKLRAASGWVPRIRLEEGLRGLADTIENVRC